MKLITGPALAAMILACACFCSYPVNALDDADFPNNDRDVPPESTLGTGSWELAPSQTEFTQAIIDSPSGYLLKATRLSGLTFSLALVRPQGDASFPLTEGLA